MLSRRAWGEFKKLPGSVRRIIIAAIDHLESNLRPSNSKKLTTLTQNDEIRRLRVGEWRVVYVIRNRQPLILTIPRRPPYNYEDIDLLKRESKE